ncbi:MAG: hypothetical protein J5864_06340 [Oscillospiraceae bacterium]|nr:hypothetical protein [Oscillospiraceae bacterium]
MVPTIKRCARCYTPISFEDSADWYSHIRIKYCDECAKIVEKEKAAERFQRYKERQREAAKLRDQRLKELEIENSILREKLKAIWGDENYDQKGES